MITAFHRSVNLLLHSRKLSKSGRESRLKKPLHLKLFSCILFFAMCVCYEIQQIPVESGEIHEIQRNM